MWVEIGLPPPPLALGLLHFPPCEVTDGFRCQQTTTAAAFGCFAFVLKQNGHVGFFGAPLCSSGSHFSRVIKEYSVNKFEFLQTADRDGAWRFSSVIRNWFCVLTLVWKLFMWWSSRICLPLLSVAADKLVTHEVGGVLSQTVMGLRGAPLTQRMFGIHFQPSMICHICVA